MSFEKHLIIFITLLIILCSELKVYSNPQQPDSTNKQSTSTHLQKPSTDKLEIIRKYQDQLSQNNDLKISWKQKQYKALRKRFVTTEGIGFFKRPKKFKWEMSSIQQSWIYDNNSLYHIEQTTKQAIKYDLQGTKGSGFRRFIDLITKFDQLTQEYKIQSIEELNNNLTLHLIPKISGDLESVKVKYNTSSNIIDNVRMSFHGGNYTLLNFFGHNKLSIDDRIFSVPSGYTVQFIK